MTYIPFFHCIWNRMLLQNQRIIELFPESLPQLVRCFDGLQESVNLGSDFSKDRSDCSKYFLDLWSDTIQRQGTIKIGSCSTMGYASVIFKDSEVTFLEKGRMHLFVHIYCALFIHMVIEEVCCLPNFTGYFRLACFLFCSRGIFSFAHFICCLARSLWLPIFNWISDFTDLALNVL